MWPLIKPSLTQHCTLPQALTKLDQAEVQVASMGGEGAQRLSLVVGVVGEAVQPALTEGYAILEVTGGKDQPHNMVRE